MTELNTDRRFHNLTREQIHALDQVLTEVIPIHGRGNFPTLEVKPKDIIHAVRNMLIEKQIKVRDVRLNGSTASHVLVKENGTSYKDLDIIFGVEISKQEDFQIIKEVVLGCLMDFLPRGVNKDKITPLTMKEAYVQKMVKVFTEHDRWSLISLSNNSGKNVELKFVNSLRRQFEFSVDSFQIILDSILKSYLEAKRRQVAKGGSLENYTCGAETSQPLRSSAELKLSTSPDMIHENQADEVGDTSVFDNCSCRHEEAMKKDKQSPLSKSMGGSEALDQTEDMEVNDPEPELDLVTQNKAEPSEKQNDEETTMPIIEKETDTPTVEARRQVTTSQTNDKSLNLEIQVESSENFETAVTMTDSTSPPETTLAKDPAALKLPCKPSFQTFSCLAQNNQDSSMEFPLPPPAKKSFKKSQMVVLKHSSPKPPRKMSKKVTSGPVSLAKAPSTTELPFLVNPPLGPTKKNPEESIPISNKVPSPVCSESPINTPQDKCQVKKLDIPTVACHSLTVHINGTDPHNEAACLQRNPNESKNSSLQPQAKFTEPEITELGNKDKNLLTHISSIETQFTSYQLPEPVSETPDSDSSTNPARQVSELISQVPEYTVRTLKSTVQVLDFGVQVPEPPLQEPQHGVQTKEPVAQSFTEGTNHVVPFTYLIPQVPQLVYQVPYHPSLESESAAQMPEPNSQELQSPQAGEQQTGSKPEGKETEGSPAPTELRDITVVAESMYGDFEQAMDHLRYRLIATRNPEEIRGGGLLKYSNLLVRDFKPASETEIKTLERYMCSRFFIDFPDVNEQQRKIESYLRNHFIGEEKSKYDYLMTLRRVVNESTVCLMGHERRQTLNMITILALKVLGEQNIIPNTTNVTCYYQPAPYMADHSFNNYYISHSQPPLIYHPYPLHLHIETGLV